MKKFFSFVVLSIVATFSFAAEISRQELIKSLEIIKKKHNPKYLVYHNDKIVADYQAFAKERQLSDACKMEYHKRLMMLLRHLKISPFTIPLSLLFAVAPICR